MKKNILLRLHLGFLLFISLWLLLALTTRAQQVPMAAGHLQGQQVKARINNSADAFWNLLDRPAYEVPLGSGLHSSFAGSLWIGGLDVSGQLHLAAQTYRQGGIDFYAGPVRNGAPYDMPRTVDFPEALTCNTGVKVPDGRVAFTTATGFFIVDAATGAGVPVTTGLQAMPDTDPVFAHGKVYGVFKAPGSSIAPQYLVAWDTAAYTYSIACTLSAKTMEPCLTALSTGSVLIADTAMQVYNPGASTSWVIGGPEYHPGACALLFPGDSVLVIGGSSPLTTWYHHGTGALWPGPTLPTWRWKPAVTTLPGGGWILTGSNADSTTDVLDAAATAFTTGPALTRSFGEVAAATTADGKVVFRGMNSLQVLQPGGTAFEALEWPATSTMVPHLTQMEGDWFLTRLGADHMYFNLDADKPDQGHYQHVWSVTRAEIDAFLADFAAGAVDFSLYPDIETWPGNGKWWASEDAQLAPYVDVNGDGQYKPAVHGDYPCITGDHMLWHVYHDDGPHGETNGLPLGIQVEQSSYVYDQALTTCTDTLLDYATFYHLEITHKGTMAYHDVYLGYFLDADLGNYVDDYIGCDTTRELGFCYNGDMIDEGDLGYGANPPAIGLQVLNGPASGEMSHFMTFQNDNSAQGNPTEAGHFYGYLQSTWKDGSDVTEGCGSATPSDHMFPGDPGWCGGPAIGCTEFVAGSTPFDRRFVMSVGPFDLSPGDKVELDYSILWARGGPAGNLGAVCRLQEAADNISTWWKTQTFPCFDLVIANDDPAPAMASTLFPNPSTQQFTVQWDKPLTSADLITVTDLQGRVLLTQAVAHGSRSVQLRHTLAAGMYLVQAPGGVTHKLVVE